MHLSPTVAALLLAATPLAAQKYGRPSGLTFPPNPNPYLSVTLFASPDGRARLIDHAGDEIVPGGVPSPFAGELLATVEPLPGSPPAGFIATSRTLSAPAKHVLVLDWNGNLMREWVLPPQYLAIHHDVELLPNGHLLLLCSEVVPPGNVISAKEIRDDVLLEVAPDDSIVWTWRLRDHVDQLGLDPATRVLIDAKGGDWAHANAAESIPPNTRPDPEWRAGNVMLSMRFLSRVCVISRANGWIAWTLRAQTFGQHNAHFVPNPTGGSILLFDNGSAHTYPHDGLPRAPGESRVREFSPDDGSEIWSYGGASSDMFRKRFWSDVISSAQRLANGNTLITEGVRGRLFEVTRSGEIVWEYMNPYSYVGATTGESFNVYRAYRLQ